MTLSLFLWGSSRTAGGMRVGPNPIYLWSVNSNKRNEKTGPTDLCHFCRLVKVFVGKQIFKCHLGVFLEASMRSETDCIWLCNSSIQLSEEEHSGPGRKPAVSGVWRLQAAWFQVSQRPPDSLKAVPHCPIPPDNRNHSQY